jgi:hypothetical protein
MIRQGAQRAHIPHIPNWQDQMSLQRAHMTLAALPIPGMGSLHLEQAFPAARQEGQVRNPSESFSRSEKGNLLVHQVQDPHSERSPCLSSFKSKRSAKSARLSSFSGIDPKIVSRVSWLKSSGSTTSTRLPMHSTSLQRRAHLP